MNTQQNEVQELEEEPLLSDQDAQKIATILTIEQNLAAELAQAIVVLDCPLADDPALAAENWHQTDKTEEREAMDDALTYLKYRRLVEFHPENPNLARVLDQPAPRAMPQQEPA